MTYVNRPDQSGARSKDGGRATVRWVFADATARTNFTPLHSSPQPSAYDVGSEAWQLSDDSFWSLKSINPNVWVAKGAAGSGSGNVTGPLTSTDKALARFSGTNGQTLQDGHLTETDAGALGNADKGAVGAGTMVAPTGATTGAVNQAITAAGANFTHNIPVAASTTATVHIIATITDTTASKKRRIDGWAVVDGAAGTAVLLGTKSWTTFDDAASIYSADNTGDPTTMLYGKLSVSAGNLVFTVTAHATDAQDVNVHSFVYVDAYPA